MDPALPKAIEALHRALLQYQTVGDAAHVETAIRQLATAGHAARASLPTLTRALCTLWEHVFGMRLSAAARCAGDVQFAGFVRVLLAAFERARA